MGPARRTFLTLLAGVAAWPAALAADPIPPPRIGFERGMDHVLLWTREVDADTRVLEEKLGFRVLPGGTFPDGVANRLVIFSDRRYLELLYFMAPMAEVDASFFEDMPFLRDGDGANSFGIHLADLDAAARLLSRAGFDMADPTAGAYDPDGPDGPQPAQDSIFRTLGFDVAPLPGLDPFFVWYRPPPPETPEWRASWEARTSHPNTAQRLSAVWVVTDDLEGARRVLARVGFADGAESDLAHLGARGRAMNGGGSSILLVEPTGEGRAAEALARRGPHVLGVSVEVADLDAAREIVGRSYADGPVTYSGPFGEAVLAPTVPDLGLLVEFHRAGE